MISKSDIKTIYPLVSSADTCNFCKQFEPRSGMRGSRIFFRGGGPGPTARKQSGQQFFFHFSKVLNLFYSLQRGSNGFITVKIILFQGSRGGPTFSRGGGSNFYHGGRVQMLISIETHIICDFPGGGPDPLFRPLDQHMSGQTF